MATDEAFGSEWLRWDHAADALTALWAALGAAPSARTEAVEEAFRLAEEALDAAFVMRATTAPGAPSEDTDNDHTPPWLAPWWQVLAQLGPFQQQQRQAETLHHALYRYHAAFGLCSELVHASAHEGLANLKQHLTAAIADEDPRPDSLRALYQMWLEHSEASYEQMLASPRWASAYAALTHATTDVIHCYQTTLDSGLRCLDLPNRDDQLDTQSRLVELERAVHQHQTERREVERLRTQVEQLRAEVALLRQAATNPSDSSP